MQRRQSAVILALASHNVATCYQVEIDGELNGPIFKSPKEAEKWAYQWDMTTGHDNGPRPEMRRHGQRTTDVIELEIREKASDCEGPDWTHQ